MLVLFSFHPFIYNNSFRVTDEGIMSLEDIIALLIHLTHPSDSRAGPGVPYMDMNMFIVLSLPAVDLRPLLSVHKQLAG